MIVRLVCLLMVAATWSTSAAEPAETKLPTVTFGPFPVPDKVSVIQAGMGRSATAPERQAKQKAADAATAKAQAFLPLEPDDSYQPSLSGLRRWVSTLNFGGPPQ